MIALAAAELLKLRTTRARFGYPLGAALLAGLATAATIGAAGASDRSAPGFARDVAAAAGAASLAAFTLGIVLVTAEFRHGTVTPTFLAAPKRWPVVCAKGAAALICGAMLGLVAAVTTMLVAGLWLAALGEPLRLADQLPTLSRVVLASALVAALGASLGTVLHGQAGALVGGLLGLLVAEPLVARLAALLGIEGVGSYLPGGATALVAAPTPDNSLSLAAALAVSLAWIGGLGALGCLPTLRRDFT